MTTLFIFAMAAISLLLAALMELGEGVFMAFARMPKSKKSRTPLILSLAALALFLWGVGRIFMHIHIHIQ